MLSVLIASESLTLPACRVRDGVFSASACSALHEEACTLGRSKHLLHRGSPRSVLEQALDSFLDEVDDPDRYVEYWTRQQWVHLEAHADVDEALCAATGCGDQPGARYRCVKRSAIRADPDLASERTAFLEVGEELQVLENQQ